MKYPFEEDILPDINVLSTDLFEEECYTDFFPEIISDKFVAVRGCIKDDWNNLFLSVLNYSVKNTIKYMYFVWPYQKIKVKTSKYKDIILNQDLVQLDLKVQEFFVYPNLFETLQNCDESETCQVKLASAKRIPKLSDDNPSCISIVNELNLNIYCYTLENIGNKNYETYISNCVRYSSCHGFNYIIFQILPKSRSSNKEILSNVIDNINNSHLSSTTSKIILNIDFSMFEYSIRKIKRFLKKLNKEVSFCLDAIKCQIDSYILLKTMYNLIPISLVYISKESNFIMLNTSEFCRNNNIQTIVPIQNEFFENEIEDFYIFRKVVDKSLLKRLKKYFTKKYPITVYGNKTVTPRTQLLFADEGIDSMNYSTTNIPSKSWTEDTIELKNIVKELSTYTRVKKFSPNSCLVNGYIEKKDKVGAHRDKNLKDGNDIVCTVSIGGTRRFTFRKYKENIIIKDIEVNNGDAIFIMGNLNNNYTHCIETHRQEDNFEFKPRYSCTFRNI